MKPRAQQQFKTKKHSTVRQADRQIEINFNHDRTNENRREPIIYTEKENH